MAKSVTSERSTNSVALRVMVLGNLAYLADTDAFRIYDVTNRLEPRLVRSEIVPAFDVCTDQDGGIRIALGNLEYPGTLVFHPEKAPIPETKDFGLDSIGGARIEEIRLWNGKTLVAVDPWGQVTAYPDAGFDRVPVPLLENMNGVQMVLPENPVPKVAAFGRRTELLLIRAPVDPMYMWFVYPRLLGSLELKATAVAIAQQDPVIAWVACRENELLAVQT
jgi:hypothetical protein